MSIRVQLPRMFAPAEEPTTKIIPCPYPGCTGHLDPAMHGEIVSIWAGHGPEPAPSNRIH